MPDEILDKIEKTSQDVEMDRQSESETPLTFENEQEQKEKPLAYAKLVVTHSSRVFGIGIGVHMFMLLLTVILLLSGYDIMKPDFATLPLSLNEDSTKLRTDAWQTAHTDDSITPSSSVTAGQNERSILYMPLELFYESQGGNVFTKENLLKIKENEDSLFNDPKYKSELCQMQTIASRQITVCKRPLSIIRFFDGSYKSIDATFEDPDFNNIVTVLTKAKNITLTSAILNFHIGRDAVIDKDRNMATSKYTRSLLYFGWPLKGYKSTEVRDFDQRERLNKEISDLYAERLEETYKDKLGDMNFYYFCFPLLLKAMESQVVYDMALAIASFVFIFLFMLIQTGSIWITSWGIFSIISSFNIANFIYRVVFDYKYFGIFHVLAIFIILGIGSDNIFVFMDTWKEHGRNHPNSDLASRLSVVLKTAGKATFITSLTTTIAFLSNVQSPLLAVSSFGLFSAILVAVNYCSCTLFLPTVIVFHEQRRKGRCCFWPMYQRANPRRSIEMPEIGEETENNETTTVNNQGNIVVRFLGGWFYENVITHKHVRWGVLSFFVIMVCVFLGFAASLGPDKDQVQVFGKNTNWGKVDDMRKTAFLASQEDDVLAVHIIWGLKEQDLSDCHMTDYKCKGRTVFDDSFDVNPPPCQTALLKFCEKLQNLPSQQEKKLRLRRSEITGKVETQCVFSRMDEWLQSESNKTKYPLGTDFTLPTSGEKIIPLMAANPQLYNVSLLPDTYYRFFEVALAYFIFDGKSPEYANSYDFEVYSPLVGGSLDEGISGRHKNIMQGNKYGHRLKFLAIALNTTINPTAIAYQEGLPIYHAWEDFINEHMKEMPPSCCNGFQATVGYNNVWHWLKVQEILVWSAITGILIGLVSSFAVLVMATTNIIVGALASLTISLITCCVLGTITMIGWKLGVLESLNLTLVVGLAVDYVVHLAEGYMDLVGEDRLTKVHHTLTHVGISVLSGACTTLGASVFMLAAKIVFFFQFGIFIFCTISLSIIFSLLFFTTILALIGPQEDEKGSIKPAVRYCIDHIRGKRKNNTHCHRCNGKGFIPLSNDQNQ